MWICLFIYVLNCPKWTKKNLKLAFRSFTHSCTCEYHPIRSRQMRVFHYLHFTGEEQAALASRTHRGTFPTCWRGWDVRQRVFVPLVLSRLFPLLPSHLATSCRPTPRHAEQPIAARLSIQNPPPPAQSPGLQKHSTRAGKILDLGLKIPLLLLVLHVKFSTLGLHFLILLRVSRATSHFQRFADQTQLYKQSISCEI